MTRPRIYLDNNATTQILPSVADVMADAWRDAFANPGSRHAFGRDARQLLDSARDTVAAALNCDASEVVFTSGGTESINAAVHAFMAGRRGAIAITLGEHPATVAACRRATEGGGQIVTMPVDESGRLIDSALVDLPWSDLRLVCVILAHNETGVIQDLTALADRCEQHRVPLFVDAVQAVGKIPVNFRHLRASALAFGAHKFHGPRGTGGLIVRRGIRLTPLLDGGHQESGRRAGTESVPLIAGMAASLKHFINHPQERMEAVTALRDRLQGRLERECDPVVVHGRDAPRLPNTLSIAFPGIDGEALLVNLDLEGVACSLGSTCASGSAEPAPALIAMQVPPDICLASVRFSLSCRNSIEEVEDAADRIAAVVRRMRTPTSVTIR